MFIRKCGSCHSQVQFLDIWPSKSGPNMWCFAHFDLQMCFAPQCAAACDFWTSDLQKLVRPFGVLCILTDKCASRHSRVRFLDIGTSKIGPSLRCFPHFDWQMCFTPQRRTIFEHQNVQNWSDRVAFCAFWLANVPFFICLLNSYLRTRRFSEATFRTSGTTNHWENTAIRDFPNIWRMWIFFLVTLLACWSSFCWLDCSTLLFNCPYCRKLDF